MSIKQCYNLCGFFLQATVFVILTDFLRSILVDLKVINLSLGLRSFFCRCSHCDFAAIMDPSDKVFQCQGCFKVIKKYILVKF